MPSPPPIEFLPYSTELAPHFKRINAEWIDSMFEVEAVDLKSLDHPEREIIEPGGQIIFARHPELGVLGVCALKQISNDVHGNKLQPGTFELTKMGVSASSRGLKIGERLLEHVLQVAAQTPSIERLFLLTSAKCEAAIHLYEKHGFTHDEEIMQTFGAAYERCDVAMRFAPIWSTPKA